MKKKLLSIVLLCSFTGICAEEKMAAQSSSGLPALEEPRIFSKEEIAALEAYRPEPVSPVRQWCNAQLITMFGWYLRCYQCISSPFTTPQKKRKKRRTRSRRSRVVEQ